VRGRGGAGPCAGAAKIVCSFALRFAVAGRNVPGMVPQQHEALACLLTTLSDIPRGDAASTGRAFEEVRDLLDSLILAIPAASPGELRGLISQIERGFALEDIVAALEAAP
jgi:hypothetical protein